MPQKKDLKFPVSSMLKAGALLIFVAVLSSSATSPQVQPLPAGKTLYLPLRSIQGWLGISISPESLQRQALTSLSHSQAFISSAFTPLGTASMVDLLVLAFTFLPGHET